MFKLGYPPSVCMEEESESNGRGIPWDSERRSDAYELLRRVMDERDEILKDATLSVKDKARLLATGQYALTIASGGKWRSFKSEQVVYAILAFSAIVLVILACLTAFSKLPKEVTIAFVGTVVGGTLTTVAQKLGRL